MNRRNFIKTTSVVAGAYAIVEPSVLANLNTPEEDKLMNT